MTVVETATGREATLGEFTRVGRAALKPSAASVPTGGPQDSSSQAVARRVKRAGTVWGYDDNGDPVPAPQGVEVAEEPRKVPPPPKPVVPKAQKRVIELEEDE